MRKSVTKYEVRAIWTVKRPSDVGESVSRYGTRREALFHAGEMRRLSGCITAVAYHKGTNILVLR